MRVVDGARVIALIGADGGVLYIAARGKPYPLRVDAPGGAGSVRFSDFGTAPLITAPPADEVFELPWGH